MTSPDAGSAPPNGGQFPQPALQFPIIWIGYALGVATIIAEYIALSLHPELAQQGGIPPLYLFLVSFIGGVYWLTCIHRLHAILAQVSNGRYPISPARAVGFHFIPFYNFYWVFKWPREIANFVNSRLSQPIMKPVAVGLAILAALVLRIFDPGFGLILLFFPISYVCECIRRVVAAPRQRPADDSPAST